MAPDGWHDGHGPSPRLPPRAHPDPSPEAPVTDETVRGFCRSYCKAWNSRDPERVLALATPDVWWEDPTIPGGEARGHEPVRAWLAGFWRAFPDMVFEPWYAPGPDPLDTAFLTRDRQRLAVPWRCEGTMLGPLDPPGFAPTGRRVRLTGVDLYTLRGPLLCHVQTITDLAEASRQLGLLPAAGSRAERLAAGLQRLGARLWGKPAGPG
jgi:hypothetical protein